MPRTTPPRPSAELVNLYTALLTTPDTDNLSSIREDLEKIYIKDKKQLYALSKKIDQLSVQGEDARFCGFLKDFIKQLVMVHELLYSNPSRNKNNKQSENQIKLHKLAFSVCDKAIKMYNEYESSIECKDNLLYLHQSMGDIHHTRAAAACNIYDTEYFGPDETPPETDASTAITQAVSNIIHYKQSHRSQSLHGPDSESSLRSTKYAKMAFQAGADYIKSLDFCKGRKSRDVNLMKSTSRCFQDAYWIKMKSTVSHLDPSNIKDIESLVGKETAKQLTYAASIAHEASVNFAALYSSAVKFETYRGHMPAILGELRTVYLDCAFAAMCIAIPALEDAEPANTDSNSINSAQSAIESLVEHINLQAQYITKALELIKSEDSNKKSEAKAKKVDGSYTKGTLIGLASQSGLLLLPEMLSGEVQDTRENLLDSAHQVPTNQNVGFGSENDEEVDDVDEIEDSLDLGLILSGNSRDTSLSKDKLTKLKNTLIESKDFLSTDFKKPEADCFRGVGITSPDITKRALHGLADRMQEHAKKITNNAKEIQRLSSSIPKSDSNELAKNIVSEAAGIRAELLSKSKELKAKAKDISGDSTYISLIKSYPRPIAEQWHHLINRNEIENVSEPRYLVSDPPKTLIEIKIQCKPDLNGQNHPPAWLHLHMHKPLMSLSSLPALKIGAFAAVHLKSDSQKNLGITWVRAMRALGDSEAHVHRSVISSEAILRGFLEKIGQTSA